MIKKLEQIDLIKKTLFSDDKLSLFDYSVKPAITPSDKILTEE